MRQTRIVIGVSIVGLVSSLSGHFAHGGFHGFGHGGAGADLDVQVTIPQAIPGVFHFVVNSDSNPEPGYDNNGGGGSTITHADAAISTFAGQTLRYATGDDFTGGTTNDVFAILFSPPGLAAIAVSSGTSQSIDLFNDSTKPLNLTLNIHWRAFLDIATIGEKGLAFYNFTLEDDNTNAVLVESHHSIAVDGTGARTFSKTRDVNYTLHIDALGTRRIRLTDPDAGASLSAATGVPEPSALVLLFGLIGTITLLPSRWRRVLAGQPSHADMVS